MNELNEAIEKAVAGRMESEEQIAAQLGPRDFAVFEQIVRTAVTEVYTMTADDDEAAVDRAGLAEWIDNRISAERGRQIGKEWAVARQS